MSISCQCIIILSCCTTYLLNVCNFNSENLVHCNRGSKPMTSYERRKRFLLYELHSVDSVVWSSHVKILIWGQLTCQVSNSNFATQGSLLIIFQNGVYVKSCLYGHRQYNGLCKTTGGRHPRFKMVETTTTVITICYLFIYKLFIFARERGDGCGYNKWSSLIKKNCETVIGRIYGRLLQEFIKDKNPSVP